MGKKIILFGDTGGIEQLLKYISNNSQVCAIVGASIRSQYYEDMKLMAKKLGVAFLIQPKYKSKEYKKFINDIKTLNPNILLCNSYSMIVRNDVRSIFNYNCINIHGALLPRNRGPNPTQWAIIKGELNTGVTIHYMNDDLDSGDIICQKKVPIEFQDTWVTVKCKLKIATDKLLEHNLQDILSGKNKKIKQDDSKSTVNFRLTPEYPKIDFDKMKDKQIYDLIRAQVSPLSGAYIENNNGERIYIKEIKTMEEIKIMRIKYEK